MGPFDTIYEPLVLRGGGASISLSKAHEKKPPSVPENDNFELADRQACEEKIDCADVADDRCHVRQPRTDFNS